MGHNSGNLRAVVLGLDDTGVELRPHDVLSKPGASLSFGNLFDLAISTALGQGFARAEPEGADPSGHTAPLRPAVSCRGMRLDV